MKRMGKQNLKNEELKSKKLEIRKKVIQVFLKEFKIRREADLHYSIRRFASDIGMNHIHLNQVLLSQRGLSRLKAEIISRKFKLNIDERKRFYLLVSASCARSVLQRNLALMGLENKYNEKIVGRF